MFGAPPTRSFSPADTTISSGEAAYLDGGSSDSCDDEKKPTFWTDMCSQIPTNATDYLNLQRNPERWTGYNGSHVWAAIYNENCVKVNFPVRERCSLHPHNI